jgi:phosphinothricin acetyltransferase
MQTPLATSAIFRPATAHDAAAITDIYNFWVTTSSASFDTLPVTEAAFAERLANPQLPCWVAATESKLLGYASARHFRPFAGSAHVAETAIYLQDTCRGHGIGLKLYQALLESLPSFGFEVAVALITDPNPASEHLHKKVGFIRQGVLPDLGRKNRRSLTASLWTRQSNESPQKK